MKKLIATKLGMTQIFLDTGELLPVTALKVEKNFVLAKKNEKKDGYNSCIFAAKEVKEKYLSKAVLGIYKKNKISPSKYIFEVKNCDFEKKPGDLLDASTFEIGDYVDISGMSKGKGFQGVIKRHGFSGGEATHGSKFHRANGSTGQAAWPSKVFKGTKMAGRMGYDKVTVQNLKIVKVDLENNVIVVSGAVPGKKKGLVMISSSKKRS